MLRLLFTTAAIIPVAILPWAQGSAEAIEASAIDGQAMAGSSYVEGILDPALQTLAACEESDLPVFFRDGFVTTHSAEFVQAGLQQAAQCDRDMKIEIVPILPEGADGSDRAQAVTRTAELKELVRVAGYDAEISRAAQIEDVSTLYMNGRAAKLRIDPTP